MEPTVIGSSPYLAQPCVLFFQCSAVILEAELLGKSSSIRSTMVGECLQRRAGVTLARLSLDFEESSRPAFGVIHVVAPKMLK